MSIINIKHPLDADANDLTGRVWDHATPALRARRERLERDVIVQLVMDLREAITDQPDTAAENDAIVTKLEALFETPIVGVLKRALAGAGDELARHDGEVLVERWVSASEFARMSKDTSGLAVNKQEDGRLYVGEWFAREAADQLASGDEAAAAE